MSAFVLSDEPDMDATPVLVPGPPNGNGHTAAASNENSDADQGDTDDEPPNEAVVKWRADYAKRLEERVTNERSVKRDRTDKAAEMLRSMHTTYSRKRENTADVNAKQQNDIVANRDGIISRMSKKGEKPNWDIVPNLADLSGTFKEGARDTSRMRQVLLRMKQ